MTRTINSAIDCRS